MEIIVILAGGDFTGRVFCSTLEGEFVKAFGYTNGQLNGTLVVMKRSELEKHRDKGWGQNYSSVNLMEGVRTRAGTYVFDEGGSSSGLCPHGYPENSCSICLDEVIVTGCRYCHMQNGCICDCCFYCGNKEPECTYMRCTRCRNKMQDCICYIYPDPNPNPGGGGGGETPPPPSDPKPEPEIPPTPKADAIYSSNSTLNQTQKQLLNQALSDFCERCPQFKKMYDRLIELGKQIKFELNPIQLQELGGLAGYLNGRMMFLNADAIQVKYLQEEMIHAIQDCDIYGHDVMVNARKNIEFEAKVIQDILFLNYQWDNGGSMGSMGQSSEFMDAYSLWILEGDADRDILMQRFHKFCNSWTGYSGKYNPSLKPGTIEKYLK